MSLAMVLANQYGIVMSADKRMTLAPKTSDGQTFLYPSLNHQQKLFMTKSGHGIAFTGTLTLDDGTATAVVIRNAIAKYNSPRTSVLDELKGLKNALKQYTKEKQITLVGAEINNGKRQVFTLTLTDKNIEKNTNEEGLCLLSRGDCSFAEMLMSFQSRNSNCVHFSLQESINYLRFVNSTVAKLQYYNGNLQSVSEECDVLVLTPKEAKWVISPETLF